jgi:hypothetical protein
MGYKMKRGAKPKFSELGSSPAKQKMGFGEKADVKVQQEATSPIKGKGDNLKRIMTENKAAQKKAGTWYKPHAEPKISKVPTFSASDRTLHENLNKIADRYRNPKPTKIVHKGAVNIAKNVGRKLAKIAAKRLGPVGTAITAYEAVKTIPKVTKATTEGLKEKAKSGNVNLGRKL